MSILCKIENVAAIARFPLLRKHISSRSFVVLFTSETSGTVIAIDGPCDYQIGDCHSKWESCFDSSHWAQCSVTLTSEN